MRACQPSRDGYVERDGVKLHYELFGAGEPTVMLLPTWSIIHSRHWKMQIPYLARHCRVLIFDGRGNGRSDRPTEPAAYAESEFAADAIAVRLAGNRGPRLVELAERTVRNVARGVIGTALIQSTLVGLGLVVAGVPAAAFLTLYLLPVARQLGPSGGTTMTALTGRGFHRFMAANSGLTILSGLWLYWTLTAGFAAPAMASRSVSTRAVKS